MGMKGMIAEGRAWKRRENASEVDVAIYVAARWPMLDQENRKWMAEKINENEEG